MYRIQANLFPGLKGVELLTHGDDGGPEGISLMFGGSVSPDSIQAAEIPWFDGLTVDLDGLKAVVADISGFDWASGHRELYPDYSNGNLTFYVTP